MTHVTSEIVTVLEAAIASTKKYAAMQKALKIASEQGIKLTVARNKSAEVLEKECKRIIALASFASSEQGKRDAQSSTMAGQPAPATTEAKPDLKIVSDKRDERIAQLEQENAALKAEVARLNQELAKAAPAPAPAPATEAPALTIVAKCEEARNEAAVTIAKVEQQIKKSRKTRAELITPATEAPATSYKDTTDYVAQVLANFPSDEHSRKVLNTFVNNLTPYINPETLLDAIVAIVNKAPSVEHVSTELGYFLKDSCISARIVAEALVK